MNLTIEQERAIRNGQAVRVKVAGAECVLVRKDVYDRGDDLTFDSWTATEMNLLATETADLLAGDGLDELPAHAAGGDRARFEEALAKVADVEPEERDRL